MSNSWCFSCFLFFHPFSDLRTTRARLLEMFTDVTCNPEIMKNATDAYFSLLQGLFTLQQIPVILSVIITESALPLTHYYRVNWWYSLTHLRVYSNVLFSQTIAQIQNRVVKYWRNMNNICVFYIWCNDAAENTLGPNRCPAKSDAQA